MIILIPLATFSYINFEQHHLDTGNNHYTIKESFYGKPKQIINLSQHKNQVLNKFAEVVKEQNTKQEKRREDIINAAIIKPKPVKKKSVRKGGEDWKKNKQIKNKNKITYEENDDVKTLDIKFSAYVANCTEGCTGRTKTGVDVTQSIFYKGYRVIATDPSIIPLNSVVLIKVGGSSFKAIAIDTGGAIVGNKVDLLVSNEQDAINFGRQHGTVSIIN
ncbi:3D domain-containing protein [Bacillus mojavensis]|uniref:3D domain-containing protein n=1 Tax=Bacillus mojavensis TaxID=72360 RepID=UPI002DBA937A|nr:3D domain-containing protein [Bacillus mojavensis]MEC1289506.1 3D domain-containing protein [Bacillus mojavensis]MEC1704603.1 3D domain-containing protein [Bacillus mojavensis]MEC5246101.1 3D domain-containing protein [Bacillus mojavensis]